MLKLRLYTFISIPVFALLYLQTTFFVLLSMPCSVINNRKCVRKVVHIWAITTFWIIGKRLSIKGFDKIDATKKYIIVANHASLFDIMAIMKVFPGISWFGRERLLKIPLFGTVLKMIDYIPMKTGDINNTRQIDQPAYC